MKKFNQVAVTMLMFSVFVPTAFGQQVPAIDYGKQWPNYMPPTVANTVSPVLPVLSEDTMKLNGKEQKGVGLAEQWKNKPMMPVMGDDGSVKFFYGSTLPSVVCAPLFACDVALQPGEVVQQMALGDAARWKVAPGKSGTGDGVLTHLIIKPADVGLATNLIVHTDRRSYNIRLVSKKNDWMPLVAFEYPDDTKALWDAYHEEHREQIKARAQYTVNGSSNSSLNFNYRVKGDSTAWKPVRVYSDNAKTYIQFSSRVQNDKIPALVLLGKGNQEQLVNYRLVDDRYVVDQIIDKAALIRGVGKNQERVEISRVGG